MSFEFMYYQSIPHTDLKVSQICLGTMTFGDQNTQKDAFEQMNYALDQGVNFIDTAELYAFPPKPETQGLTEKYIGNWFRQYKRRQEVVLATKVIGPGGPGGHIRPNARANYAHIEHAVNQSLKRLQTDYIDLYQLHWPERSTNFFGKLGYQKPSEKQDRIEIAETLEALTAMVKQGKIRYIGVSNETAWGVSEYLKQSALHDLARIVTVQNPYNLLNRSYENALAEFAYEEGVGLLAYSPLAFGMLTGKYFSNTACKGRLHQFPQFTRYQTPQGIEAARAYTQLAQKFNLDPAQMALAYVNQKPFVYSNIIGATTLEQLKTNIDSVYADLPDELLESIETIHKQYTYPCP